MTTIDVNKGIPHETINAYNDCIFRLHTLMDELICSIKRSDMNSIDVILRSCDEVHAKMNKLGQELFVLGSLNIKVGNAKPSEIQNEIEANLRKLVEKQAACINMLESNMQEYRNQLAELNNHSRKIMEAYLQERKLQPTPRFIDSKL